MAREALLKFGPMKFTQMTLEHDQKYVQYVYCPPPPLRPLEGTVNHLHRCTSPSLPPSSCSLYQRELVEQWTACAGMSRVQCAHRFLELARQWPLCGATLFLAQVRGEELNYPGGH